MRQHNQILPIQNLQTNQLIRTTDSNQIKTGIIIRGIESRSQTTNKRSSKKLGNRQPCPIHEQSASPNPQQKLRSCESHRTHTPHKRPGCQPFQDETHKCPNQDFPAPAPHNTTTEQLSTHHKQLYRTMRTNSNFQTQKPVFQRDKASCARCNHDSPPSRNQVADKVRRQPNTAQHVGFKKFRHLADNIVAGCTR
jgi:hypothetical protein